MDGYRVLNFGRLGEALPCAAFLLPQLTGTVSCGTPWTVLKVTGNPSLPLPKWKPHSLNPLHASWEPSLLLLYTDMISPDIALSCKKVPPSYCFAPAFLG